MNLKKLLLPLTFLGLSPAARAGDKVPTSDTVPQNKITQTVDSVKHKNNKTIRFTDAQDEYETDEIHKQLINSYNAKPHAHNIEKIFKLLTIMDNPNNVYSHLRLSVPHAQYFASKITPELQKKLHISAKEDIVFTAVNNNFHKMSDQDLFDFVATHSNLNKLQKPYIIMEKALNIALADKAQIGKSNKHINCISNIMNFALSHQDDKKITDLYAKIFVTTAHMIRDYNKNDSVKNTYAKSINALTKKIEKFNTHIIPGSVLDSEIQIKRPHDYVIQEYANIEHRINLAMVYNRAYLLFTVRAHNMRHQVYNNKHTQNLHLDYLDAIEIQYLVRKHMATDEQKQQLKNLIKKHPEINLFEPYFCNLYLNIPEYNTVLKFITDVHTNKSGKALSVPKEVLNILSQATHLSSVQQQAIQQQHINVPQINLTLPKKLSNEQLKRSVLIPSHIFNNIAYVLDQQLQDVTFQKHSIAALTTNNQQSSTTHTSR